MAVISRDPRAAPGLPPQAVQPDGRAGTHRRLQALASPRAYAGRRRRAGAAHEPATPADPAPSPPAGRRGDAPTGLSGLAGFSEALTVALAGGAPAVLLVGLTRVKAVNDGCGRSVSEALLRIVAQRLRSAVREEDLVGQFGGEEFAEYPKSWDWTFVARLP